MPSLFGFTLIYKTFKHTSQARGRGVLWVFLYDHQAGSNPYNPYNFSRAGRRDQRFFRREAWFVTEWKSEPT